MPFLPDEKFALTVEPNKWLWITGFCDLKGLVFKKTEVFSVRAGRQFQWLEAAGCSRMVWEKAQEGAQRPVVSPPPKLSQQESAPRLCWVGGFGIEPDLPPLPFVPNSECKMSKKAKESDSGTSLQWSLLFLDLSQIPLTYNQVERWLRSICLTFCAPTIILASRNWRYQESQEVKAVRIRTSKKQLGSQVFSFVLTWVLCELSAHCLPQAGNGFLGTVRAFTFYLIFSFYC